jgi:hypothetical protein
MGKRTAEIRGKICVNNAAKDRTEAHSQAMQ